MTLTLAPKLRCPECEAEGLISEFENASGLGAHRRYKHRVIGQNSSARRGGMTTRRSHELLHAMRAEVEADFAERRREYESVIQRLDELERALGPVDEEEDGPTTQ